MAKKAATWIDRQIGDRVREHRVDLGLSQGKLGEALGLTFQQIQKYENGTDRISASSLFHIAKALGISVSQLYDGLTPGEPTPALRDAEQIEYSAGAQPSQSRRLTQRFASIRDPKARKLVLDLVDLLAKADGKSEE